MTPRLTSAVLVSALMRRVQAEGGNAAVVVKGDATAGSILLLSCERGLAKAILERVLAADGRYRWTAVGPVPTESADVHQYVEKRRRADPDLWLVELDIPGVERFAAEITDEG